MTTSLQRRRPEGLSKEERLCSKSDIARLLKDGKFGHEGVLKFCWRPVEDDAAVNRIMVSVSKRLFKRAVRRNLLKRRLREAYRRNKGLLSTGGRCDIMFIYNSKEILDYKDITEDVKKILSYISGKMECPAESEK